MKIGIICYPSYGGSGGFATSLGQELAKLGHEIHLISYEVPFKLSQYWPKNIKFHQVYVTEYPVFKESSYSISLANKIAEVVNEYKLDIIHVHYAMPHAVAAKMAKDMIKRKIKIMVTLHGTDVIVMGKDNNLNETLGANIKQCDAVTAVSENLAKMAQKYFKLKKMPDVIENFVTTERIPKNKVKNLRGILANPKEKILTHISNFRTIKHTEDVVSVFKKVQKKVPSKLVLMGDGPEMPKIKRMVKRAKLNSKTHFLGFQLDVAKVLSSSDLFLFPSEREGFGLAALEAMACGVPVIGTNTLGISNIISNKKTGMLSGVGDVQSMANNAIEILTNHEKWLEMSVNSIRLVNNEYRPEHIVPKYEELYKKTTKKK